MRTYGISPKKRLGQNFMVNNNILQIVSSYADVGRTDVVLEVGAGFGFLTRLLSQKARKVVAVEVDACFIEVLRNELTEFKNVEVIEGDIFKIALPSFNKIVSNPPFSISSPLLFWLLTKTFDCAVLTFQKEFANRLHAPIDSKGYSRLTVYMSYYADVELLEPVPKKAFYPPPDVDAIIVRLKLKRTRPFKVEDEKVFDEVVRTLFTQRNRKVRNAILPLLHRYGLKGTVAVRKADSMPFCNKRVRELAPEAIGAIANELSI